MAMITLFHLSSLLLSSSFLLLWPFSSLTEAQVTTLPTRWTNSASCAYTSQSHGSTACTILFRPILPPGSTAAFIPSYACGFYCNGNCDTYLFAIYIVGGYYGYFLNSSGIQEISNQFFISSSIPQVVVVWSANRNNPVTINATVELTSEGDLVLKNGDGSTVWSTNTSGKSVVGLKLTELGNLVLYDKNNVTVWQSFDHPTDSLVPGQMLKVGQKLTPSASDTNWTEDRMLSLSMTIGGLFAQMESSPPQIYYQHRVYSPDATHSMFVRYLNGSLTLLNSERNESVLLFSIPKVASAQFIKLDQKGHLKAYERNGQGFWGEVADILTGTVGDCGYPTACGQYGICLNGQCHCPSSVTDITYFEPLYDSQYNNIWCSPTVPLSCGASQHQSFLKLANISYFTFSDDLHGVDPLGCKEACAKNCSCKVAFHRYVTTPTLGICYLSSQIFALMDIGKRDDFEFTTTTYIKVQNFLPEATNISNHNRNQKSTRHLVMLRSGLGAVSALIVLIIAVILSFVWKRYANEVKEDYFDHVPGMPTRFAYGYLKAITEDFSKRLGGGGFGTVFEGTLIDGTKVAVKRLDGFNQVEKSFVAEVETIGGIHHFNLVRLVGFCSEKCHRLLVYEYMPNGSLDKWIFCSSNKCALDWKQRKKIIVDVAKGLNYLHEDCRQKIVHLDIKPQNILLDENFNAKVADFGLSKLIAKDQTQIVTTMKGTPGYLAPEWLSAVITEKVDVYSFGIVVLEMVCGRKIFDRSQNSEDTHLLSLFKRKAEGGHLLDIVDKDMQQDGPEAMNMMRIAAWCLQSNFARRPSMSMDYQGVRWNDRSSRRFRLWLYSMAHDRNSSKWSSSRRIQCGH